MAVEQAANPNGSVEYGKLVGTTYIVNTPFKTISPVGSPGIKLTEAATFTITQFHEDMIGRGPIFQIQIEDDSFTYIRPDMLCNAEC
jgi:hypothetical protein